MVRSKSKIAHDLKIKTVKSEIRDYYINYNKRLENHPNALANHLLTKTNTQRRLKRYTTYDLATRLTRVEAGSNTSTVTLRVVRGDEKELKKRPRHSLRG
jgi:NH3-dependent NAD+ synthetase